MKIVAKKDLEEVLETLKEVLRIIKKVYEFKLPLHWRKLHSTNVLERFNKEIKRRTKVIGVFPNEGLILRLLVPLAIDTNAKWLDRNYVSFDNLV